MTSLSALLAISIGINIYSITPERGGYGVDSEAKPREYDCGRALIAIFGNEVASKASEGKSDPKNARDYATLCQNAFSLEAAKESARGTTGQFYAGIANVFLVIIATGAAIAAACFARGAFVQSRRQANAAEKAVTHARTSADAAVRAAATAATATEREFRSNIIIEAVRPIIGTVLISDEIGTSAPIAFRNYEGAVLTGVLPRIDTEGEID